MNKPTAKSTSSLFGPASTASVARSTTAAPAPATGAPASAPTASELMPPPAAPAIFNPLSSTGVSPAPVAQSPFAGTTLGSGARKAQASGKAKKLGAKMFGDPEAPLKFDNFDFEEGVTAAASTGSPAAGQDSWGTWGDEAPSPAKSPAAKAAADDPWAQHDVGSSSLFAYDAPSLHAAAPVPALPPAPLAVPQGPPTESSFGGFGRAGANDLSATNGNSSMLGAENGGGDAYGSLARNKYANATALGSFDFAALPAAAPTQVELQMDRDKWMEKYASAGAISSADLMEGPTSPSSSLARKMAESGLGAATVTLGGAKKLGGMAATWLNNRAARLNDDQM